MYPASIPSDPWTLLLALFTLFGLPLIIFSMVLFYAGYIRYDADQSLEELQAELDAADDADGPGEADGFESADGIEATAATDSSETAKVTETEPTPEPDEDVPPTDAGTTGADDISRSNADQ